MKTYRTFSNSERKGVGVEYQFYHRTQKTQNGTVFQILEIIFSIKRSISFHIAVFAIKENSQPVSQCQLLRGIWMIFQSLHKHADFLE